MGLRGPNSVKAKPKNTEKARPEPLEGMSQGGRTIWRRVVNDFEPGHFKPRSYDLLRAFCEAASSHRLAVIELEKGDWIITNPNTGITKKNPLFGIIDQETARMTSLSTKLGLTVHSVGSYSKPQKSKRDGLLFGSPGFQVYGGGEK